jgi:hypothetical protein
MRIDCVYLPRQSEATCCGHRPVVMSTPAPPQSANAQRAAIQLRFCIYQNRLHSRLAISLHITPIPPQKNHPCLPNSTLLSPNSLAKPLPGLPTTTSPPSLPFSAPSPPSSLPSFLKRTYTSHHRSSSPRKTTRQTHPHANQNTTPKHNQHRIPHTNRLAAQLLHRFAPDASQSHVRSTPSSSQSSRYAWSMGRGPRECIPWPLSHL